MLSISILHLFGIIVLHCVWNKLNQMVEHQCGIALPRGSRFKECTRKTLMNAKKGLLPRYTRTNKMNYIFIKNTKEKKGKKLTNLFQPAVLSLALLWSTRASASLSL